MFVPIIGWGQSVALVEFVSSEITEYPSNPDCGSWPFCDSTVMKLTFKEWDYGKYGPNDAKIVRELVLYYQIDSELSTGWGIDGYNIYIFPWNTLKGQLIYIEYKSDCSQFIRIKTH